MTFGEALYTALSFFWSPTMVLLLVWVVVLIGVGVILEFSGYGGSALAVCLGVALMIVGVVIFIALLTYFISNGVGPLSWDRAHE